MAKELPHDVAAVGDAESIMAFRSLGVETVPVTEPAQLEDAVIALARRGTRVIMITEPLVQANEEFVASYTDKPFPILLTIPDRAGSDGYGMGRIDSNMERAIGTKLTDDPQKEE